jgi:hypothetical protein
LSDWQKSPLPVLLAHKAALAGSDRLKLPLRMAGVGTYEVSGEDAGSVCRKASKPAQNKSLRL